MSIKILIGEQIAHDFLSSPIGVEFSHILQRATGINQVLNTIETQICEYQRIIGSDLTDPSTKSEAEQNLLMVSTLKKAFVTTLLENIEELERLKDAQHIEISFICGDCDHGEGGGDSEASEMQVVGTISLAHLPDDSEDTSDSEEEEDGFLEETVPVPLPIVHLNKTKLTYCSGSPGSPGHSSSGSPGSPGPDVCIICYDAIKAGCILRTLPCQHKYHQLCIDTWFEQSPSCPTCKTDLRSI